MKPTTEDVLKWARERDNKMLDLIHRTFPYIPIGDDSAWKRFLSFANEAYAAGAAAERERCAKVCEEIHGYYTLAMFPEGGDKTDYDIARTTQAVTTMCAAAIRALGENNDGV